MPTDLERFGEVIQEERKRQELTQDRLAELAGLHSVYISALERGTKNPTLKTMLKLSEALGTPSWDLLCRAFPPPPSPAAEKSSQEFEEMIAVYLQDVKQGMENFQQVRDTLDDLEKAIAILLKQRLPMQPIATSKKPQPAKRKR